MLFLNPQNEKTLKHILHKNLVLFLLFFSCLFTAPQLQASHVMAEEFTYSCIGTCQYQFNWRVYRDCSGSSSISVNTTAFNPQGTGCGAPTVVSAWLTTNIVTEVTPVCPSTVTNCSSGIMRGVEEFYNYAVYDFCATSCPFKVSWSSCCRNYAITAGSGGDASYTGETMIDPTVSPCNNSPVFTSLPIFFICTGNTTTVSQGCYDADGDSLSYVLDSCMDSQFATISYNPGYSFSSPLGPNWTVTMDTLTGNVTFTPTPGSVEVGVFCILVQEWRNGQLIGQLWRDIQVATTNCGTNQNPTVDSLVMVSGGTLNGNTISGLTIGQQVCFDIYSSDPDVGQNLNLFWDQNVAGGSFFDPGNVTVTDTVSGTSPVARFCFTPTQGGNYPFLITVEDDACPFAGFQDVYVNIAVSNYGAAANVTPITCLEYQFAGSAVGGAGPYTYAWTGTGGLSSSAATFTHTYPGPGTYTYSLTVTDPGGFNQTTSGSITVATTSQANLIGAFPKLGCQPDSVQLTATGPGVASYLWSTGATTPSIWAHTSGTYSVTCTDPNGCSLVDTVLVEDTISTVINGLALDYWLGPLNQQEVYLIYYNSTDSSLTAMDSVLTDSNGYFTFTCPTQYNTWYLKAAPDSAAYPNVMPTYHDSSLTWQGAQAYNLPNNLLAVILCRQGVNPGGPGFIGGLISQGANKQNDPVANLRVFLMDDVGNPVGYTNSDANGYFSFSNLALGKYSVWVDKPHIDNSIAPEVTVWAQHEVKDSLPFLLHSTYLELMSLNGQVADNLLPPSVSLSPNPFTEQVRLQIDLWKSAEVKVILHDAQGRALEVLEFGQMEKGSHRLDFNNWNKLPAGLYLIEVQAGPSNTVLKMIKSFRD